MEDRPVEMREYFRREGLALEPGTQVQSDKPVDCIVFYEDQAPLKKLPIPRHLEPSLLARRIAAAKAAGLEYEGASETDLLYIEKRKAPNVYVCHYKGPVGPLHEWVNGVEEMSDTGPRIIKPGHTRAWTIGLAFPSGMSRLTVNMDEVKTYLRSKDVKFNDLIELPWDKFRVVDEERRREITDFDEQFARTFKETK